ncbi:MAG: sodium/proton-translocating pyrophosphatase [Leptolinea sp.]|jgi:hypothetical protein|nr:sodium/proton-translocating pyrophosphatase [Leptolinea sp.]
MPDKKKLPSVLPLDTLLTALILGIICGWPVKDALFHILTGTPLSIRSLPVQIVYSIAVFGFLILFFLTAGRKFILWLLSQAYLPFFLLPIIPLAAHAYIGSFSRFVADDFSSATLAVNKGIAGATWDWYVNWSGRFSASFFDSLFGFLGPASLCGVVGVSLVLLLAGSACLLWQLLPSRSTVFRLGLSIFLPALVLVSAFGLTPDLPQSLYWGQGMRSLIFPLIPAAFLSAFIFLIFRRLRLLNMTIPILIVFLLGLFAGGFGETYVTIQTTVFGLAFCLVLFNRQKEYRARRLPLLLAGLLASLAAMALIIAAPGNRIRQSYFPTPPGLWDLLSISAASLGKFLHFMVNSPDRLIIQGVLLGAGLLTGYLYAGRENIPSTFFAKAESPLYRGFWRVISLTGLLAAILLYTCFVPAAYGMSNLPPDRTWIIPVLILCVFLVVWGFLLGIRLRLYKKLTLPCPKVIAWLLFFLLAFYTFRITEGILSVRADYQRFADAFDQADRTIREARAEGMSSVQIPEVHNHFGLSDYGAGTTYWLDQAVDSYYGIHVIINKSLKIYPR